MTTDLDATRKAPCTKCGARKGDPCTYVLSPHMAHLQGQNLDHYSGSTRAILARVGQPMKHTHNERRNAVRALEKSEYRKALLADQKLFGPSEELRQAAHAMREWDLKEHARLKTWLIAYGHILIEGTQ